MSIFFNQKVKDNIKDTLKDLAFIIILVVLIRTFIVSPYEVSGPSMCPTLNFDNGICNHAEGEYLIVNKFWYDFSEPQRGDIVVFKRPGGTESFIKRIIGLPGDIVILKDGFVYLQNQSNPTPIKLDESQYLSRENLGHTMPFRNATTFTVPENSYFMMGDNRIESLDSRASFTEFAESKGATPYVPKENFAGKAWIVLWPLGNFGVL
ncbi:MAG: signal peptidase I, signal peptidase I [Candidatus Peregrinibacteria bacterium GW2011_GWF2_33_10]|nr:MAG: signal peptidase I, signal peptidase I [Candidatus Peregrinibacteria bacterium GW2011_GWF2_33_10]OGJ45637.1 MAG: signal peptidase I [Candidatus Peregrinibacteria bacterium RIFOXYA2_FULL_33_21]OGJ46566.1 MAG: signal peptidase I [Candidatus Peregrinibacteria bacterium RIFOXYA12_FULL_33_12]OGJ51229.1 MAG: signal peptidase I [Candidatus Peregrinibacteria bacterium RIFOXYB2_FULL_33_20]